jgi:hypothetical protein
MVIAKMRTGHVPVEVLGLDTERKTSAGNRFNAV